MLDKDDDSKNFLEPKCGDNQVYEVRSECPKTCLYPSGSYNCGCKKPVEDCYCADGFVVDSNGKCVTVDECGCETPDGKSIINVLFYILLILYYLIG